MLRTRYKSLTLLFVSATILCIALMWIGDAAAKSKYPSKPVQLIVPWKPGGGTDVIMRIITHYASQYLEEPMVVVNVPGVGGTLGPRKAKDARPDGYTIVTLHQTLICSKLSGVCDFEYSSFIPIAGMTNTPDILTVRGDAPWNNLKELIEDAKKKPGEITYGGTFGTTTHFFPLQVSRKAGVKFKFVSYEGTAERQTALLGGYIDMAPTNITSGKKYFEARKFKALGIATEERHPLIPDVPTLKELGMDVQSALYRGMWAPLGTPKPIIDKLTGVFKKVAGNPEFVKKITDLGSFVRFAPQDKYKAIMDAEVKEFTELVEVIGMKPKR